MMVAIQARGIMLRGHDTGNPRPLRSVAGPSVTSRNSIFQEAPVALLRKRNGFSVRHRVVSCSARPGSPDPRLIGNGFKRPHRGRNVAAGEWVSREPGASED